MIQCSSMWRGLSIRRRRCAGSGGGGGLGSWRGGSMLRGRVSGV